ncbi:hypothetical protein, partial [Streptococcus sanguinis]|uniref:hypothetical protein n=1 Tax=Streptococcus sanguinis TaxID=1305 RepID=UPI001D15BFAD
REKRRKVLKKKVNNYFTDFTDEISQQVNEDYKKIEKEFFPLEKWYTTKEIVGLLKEHTPPVNDEGIPYLYTVNKQTAKERMLHTDLVDKSFYLDYTEKRVGEIIKNDILGIDELYEEGVCSFNSPTISLVVYHFSSGKNSFSIFL